MTNYAKVDHTNRRIVMDRTFAKNAKSRKILIKFVTVALPISIWRTTL